MGKRWGGLRAGKWPGTVSTVLLSVLALVFSGPSALAQETGKGHYPLYRESETRCLTVRGLKNILPGDRVFGGPYPLEQALSVLRARCPVQVQPSGEWFAVRREDGCWLVPPDQRLGAGDLIIAANAARPLARRRLEESCASYRVQGAQVARFNGPEAPPAPPPEAPAASWATTSVPWIDVYSRDSADLRVREVTPKVLPPKAWQPLTPFVALEPPSSKAVPSAVRVRLPSTVQVAPGARDRVALAFFEESTAHDGTIASATWHLHAPAIDPATGELVAEVHHASVFVWIVVAGGSAIIYEGAPLAKDAWTRFRMQKIDGEHFVLHYPSPAISPDLARWTLEVLEKTRRFLKASVADGGAGVVYPTVPAKLDVYYITLSKPGEDPMYGLFQQGKSGGKWLDINLPSNIPGYDRRVLRQTLAHELFHFVQFPWEGYSTWWNAWVAKATGTRFPYGWLNEALSTAVELEAVEDPSLQLTSNAPIYDADMCNKGLKGLRRAKEGYGAGLFVHYLVRRYGRELLQATLWECKRQVDSGTERDPYVALRRAVRRRSDALAQRDPAGSDPDRLWTEFAEQFLQDRPGSRIFDARLDRTRSYTTPSAWLWKITTGKTTQTWAISVPPLSLKGQAAKIFKLTPAQRDASGEAWLDCEARFKPDPSMPFDVVTPIHMSTTVGKRPAPLPVDALLKGTLNRSTTFQSFQVHVEKQERWTYLSFNPVGLGAGAPSGTGPATASYELSCQLHEEPPPAAPPVPVSTSAIDTYYRTLQRAATLLRGRWADHEPARMSEVCPECEERYEAAHREGDAIARKIGALEDRVDKLSDEAAPVLKLLKAYYEGAAGRWVSPEDAPTIQYLMEVNDQIGDLQEVCGDLPHQPFQRLAPLSVKSYLALHPSRVESNLRHARRVPVPSAEEVEKALEAFHRGLASMKPCQEQIRRYEDFWKERKDKVLRDVEHLKASYPGL